jgi:hypothetical protein
MEDHSHFRETNAVISVKEFSYIVILGINDLGVIPEIHKRNKILY